MSYQNIYEEEDDIAQYFASDILSGEVEEDCHCPVFKNKN